MSLLAARTRSLSPKRFGVFFVGLLSLVALVPLAAPARAHADGSVTAADFTKTVQGDTNNVFSIGDLTKDLTITGGTDDAPLQFTAVSSATNGTASIQSDGTASNDLIQYAPNAKYSGSDSFTYTVSNGPESATANIMLTVTPGNTNYAPVTVSDSYTRSATDAFSVDKDDGVLTNDSDKDRDPLTAHLVTTTAHGTLALASDGSFTYTPGQDFTGTDSFTYNSNDGKTDGNIVTVSLTVTYPPVAVGDGDDLQAAIDAALPHSTVTISGNPLPADITISKPLTLTGSGTITGKVSIEHSGVSISGLTITNPGGDTGILVDGVSDVSLTGNTISDVGTTAVSGDATAIRVVGAGGISDITISGNHIQNIGNAALTTVSGLILGDGSDTGNVTASVTDNTIDTLSGTTVQGIAFMSGTPSVTLTGNTLQNFTGSTEASALSIGTGVTGSALTAHENTFDLTNIQHGVITADTGTAVDVRKNFWGVGMRPDTVSSSGVVTSPWYSSSQMYSLAYATVLSGDGTSASAHISDGITQTIHDNSDASPVSLTIPPDTTVTSNDPSWNGAVNAPTATTTDTTVTLAGYDAQVTSSVEMGSPDVSLTLSHAARIVFSNQIGKTVGWIDHNGTFVPITAGCDADDQDTADLLPNGGDCVITIGNDLVVWTKHFTTFEALNFVPVVNSLEASSNNSNPRVAKVGDTVTVEFSSLASLSSASVVFEGNTSIDAQQVGNMWIASYTLQQGDPEGTVSYTINLNDVNGRSGAASEADAGSSVTFDATAPVISVPSAITATTTSTGAFVSYAVSTNDGSPAVCAPLSNSLFTLGTTTVNCTSSDTAGNTSTASFDIGVSLVADDTATHGGGGRHTTPASSEGTTGTTDTGDSQVLGASVFNFTSDLTIGSRGDDVVELQNILITEGDLGAGLNTGYFGPLTFAGVKKYQAAHGITPISGYVGPRTRAVLNLGATPTMSDEQQSLLTVQIQALEAKIKALQGQ